MNSLQKQVGGNHYQGFTIPPVEFIQSNGLGFIEGCIIKYLCRYRKKHSNRREWWSGGRWVHPLGRANRIRRPNRQNCGKYGHYPIILKC